MRADKECGARPAEMAPSAVGRGGAGPGAPDLGGVTSAAVDPAGAGRGAPGPGVVGPDPVGAVGAGT
ncbi:hypothetical protein ACTMS0_13810 [Micromonospora sp. H33]|uniref:hypothetical protein n=1 Tax=Micromonospora sp. H33 TaxID=3452215 RepID=UPI003F8AC879